MREPDPSWENPTSDQIQILLRGATRVAVVGLSSDPGRPSNGVADYLLAHGYDIIPVNPTEVEVLGRKSYPNLKSVPGPVDIVDVFRKPLHAPGIVEEAIEIGAKAVWLQEDVVSQEAYDLAQTAGITIIMDLCMLKEHSRLIDTPDQEDE